MGSSRVPLEVKAVGLLQHGRQQTCLLSVSWSDQTQVLIYRTFEEFKTLHKGLKRKFPIESGLLKKSDRTLPRFRDANAMLRKNQKLSRCMESLRLLEVYCQELLKSQAKISQGEDVIKFLEAQSQDLEPSFPENSVIILPSEMGERKKEAPRISSLSITQPLVPQIYQCVAPFRTKDTQNKPFEATMAEKLEVLMKDRTGFRGGRYSLRSCNICMKLPGEIIRHHGARYHQYADDPPLYISAHGWWLVENDQKQMAWFPAPYLEDSKEMPDTEEENDAEGMLYYVTQAYRAKKPDELSIKTGIVVEVLEKSDNGWWLAWYNGTAGFIPSMFLQPYRNPHSKFLGLASRSLCRSLPNLTEAPGLSSKNVVARQKGNQVYLNQKMMQSEDIGALEGKGIRSLSTVATLGSSCSTSETESWSSSSGHVSDQGFCSPIDPESNIVFPETSHQTSGNPGSPSVRKQQNNLGFEEEPSRDPVHSLPVSGMGPVPRGPTVPLRPSPHEILQKCSSITRRALQRSLEQPGIPACSSLYP